MTITLNLAQATVILDILESTEGPKNANLEEAKLRLKMAVKEELQNNALELENITNLVKNLDPELYDNLKGELTKVSDAVTLHNTKERDKYFDEKGEIKKRRL
tara:strand:+ start:168 stop:476 length:309 start_codon:yes stop_codon:yes gene_type:complete